MDDRVYPSKDSGSLRLSEERVVEQFKKRFNEIDFSTPQFIYLNFQAAHFPYSHPTMQKRFVDRFVPRSEILAENREWVEATYWNAVANADWAVGQIADTLKQNNIYDHTTLVILGDHGESLFEDGFLGHGHAINEAQTHIPLLFNDTHIDIRQAIGQTDIAEMAIRSAFGLPNRWLDPEKEVFQLVGSLSHPTQIGHVRYGGDRIIFDFRSDRFFLGGQKQWKSFSELLPDPENKKRAVSLIHEWESLRWHEFEYLSKNKIPGEKVQSLLPRSNDRYEVDHTLH
ncbi:MAG: sulfatase-like hydrolase/transferase [Gammaproteobacteria bacterium]